MPVHSVDELLTLRSGSQPTLRTVTYQPDGLEEKTAVTVTTRRATWALFVDGEQWLAERINPAGNMPATTRRVRVQELQSESDPVEVLLEARMLPLVTPGDGELPIRAPDWAIGYDDQGRLGGRSLR